MPNDWYWCCWRCCVGWSIFHMGSCHPLKRTIILFCFSTFQNVTQTISVAWDNPEIKAVQFISTKINCKDSDLLLESVPHFLLVYSCPSLFYTVPFWLFGCFFFYFSSQWRAQIWKLPLISIKWALNKRQYHWNWAQKSINCTFSCQNTFDIFCQVVTATNRRIRPQSQSQNANEMI